MARADVELVARGLAPSRSAAQRLIADGAVRREDGRPVTRPAESVGSADVLQVQDSDETRFVSRAGAKLAHALDQVDFAPEGCTILDLGMSTGGFADCLLQRGAARVVGVEVGHGQLHPRLRGDPRVICLERTHARELTPALLRQQVPDAPAGGFDRMVADLSFISLTKVLPAVAALLAPEARLLLLVKPQFELGPTALDGRGVVTDPEARVRAVALVAETCSALGWTVQFTLESALPGGDGNIEFFLSVHLPCAQAQGARSPS